jgi:uncharacterized protein (TIGR02421 family)
MTEAATLDTGQTEELMLARVQLALTGSRPFRVISSGGNRVHVDRDLPFMCAYLRGVSPPPSLARRIAASSAIHLLWNRVATNGGDADREPEAIVDAIARCMRRQYASFLLIEIKDLDTDSVSDADSPHPREFRFDVEASGLAPETDVVATIRKALVRTEIDYRRPAVRILKTGDGPGLQDLGDVDRGIARLTIGVPTIHRSPDGQRQYPALFHQMEAAVIDAVLRAAMTFARHNNAFSTLHHRALGRRAFVQAARTVDRQMTEISGSYDFLLDLTPINSAQALDEFRRSGWVAPPQFRYRPLAIEPGELKRALYGISIGRIEDPTLEDLFREKQLEMDHQLTMLQCRCTTQFKDASRLLYGDVDEGLLSIAKSVIEAGLRSDRTGSGGAEPDDEVGCDEILAAAEKTIADYRSLCPEFDATAVLRDDTPPGLMVSGSRLLISRQTRMSARRLPSLLQHEVGVHLLTYVNGNAQGLRIFRAGLAGYERTQEGLAVFTEFATGGTGIQRLVLIAARVVAVHAMLDGASFIETFRLLGREAGMDETAAFGVALRVHRSGGLSKDAIYLQGLQQVLQHVAGGGELEPFWYGKIAAHHFDVLQELRARGMLRAPCVRPAFLSQPQGRAFIEATGAGLSVRDLMQEQPLP